MPWQDHFGALELGSKRISVRQTFPLIARLACSRVGLAYSDNVVYHNVTVD